ncbi:uncharacterized protein LY89DRAFT_630667, partial [Mollisia scopiformis]
MASDGPPQTPAGSNEAPAAVTTSPPKYVPQFSAATEMILKRIQSGATSSFASTGLTGTPAGYEDMKRSVMQSMKTTMNMELPSTPIGSANKARAARATGGSGSRSRSSATPTAASASGPKGKGSARGRGKAGIKRKRAKSEEEEETEESDSDMSKLGGDSDSDGSGSIPDLPKMTQSGRQVVKPQQFVPANYEPATKRRAPSRKSQEQALCKRCGRGHSPENNMIVFCDGCNGGWHQECHDPKVSDQAVQDEKEPWFCAECSRKKGIKTVPEPPKAVSWEGRSSEEKRAYLNSLPHPQLVSLLLQATTIHPNLPLFPPTPPAAPISVPMQAYVPRPATVRTNIYPQQPFPPSSASTAGLFSRAEANPNAPINFIRKIPPGSSQSPAPTTPASFTASQPLQSFTHASSAPPQLPAQDDSRESTPASPPYPKAGNGLMAKLGPDEEDLEWLVDANDYDAFSHVVYNEAGER